MEESGGSGLSGVLGGHHVEVQWDDVTQSFTFRLAFSSGLTELIHFYVPLPVSIPREECLNEVLPYELLSILRSACRSI